MGIAYSELPIIQDTISADPGTFLDDLHAVLLAAGWSSDPYDTGHVYACLSPQGFAVQVRIWDPADSDFPDCFAFQWVSSYDPYPEGLVHHLRMGAGFDYSVWANCCSLFIARPGYTHTGDFLPWSVHGGIPWASGVTAATPQCEAQSPAAPAVTTELWFSSGADNGQAGFGDFHSQNFRSSNFCQRFSFFRNGSNLGGDGVNEGPALQIGVLRPAGYLNNRRPTGFEAAGILWAGGTPMGVDPVISVHGIWYGQLYDSCLLSKQMALEATEQIYETDGDKLTDWINYMRGLGFTLADARFSSILLLTGGPAATVVENIAY